MLSNEIWKPVVGYEELYEVSNKGRVKALKRRKNCNRGYGFIKEHIMKPNNHGTCDYYRVPLTSKEHIKKYYMVHRLVAKAFIENPNNLPEVNHKDGNKENNCVENLEWCDRSYNIRHALEIGLKVTIKDLVNEIDRLNKRVERLENMANCYKVGGEDEKI